jgi:hypothetical protein
MNEITTVGVDLAKEVIAVCGADRSGKTVFTRVFRRERSLPGRYNCRRACSGWKPAVRRTTGRAGSPVMATHRG